MGKSRSTLVAALMLTGALLAGCGDDGEQNDVDTDTPGTVTNDREPGTSEPPSEDE